MIPAPSGIITLSDDRRLAYDDVGDPDGAVIVYLHGCPDSRLTRHPDDSTARRAGVRLVAVDRPGYGSSDASPDGDECTLADDVIALADALGVERFATLGWSSGGPGALALGGLYPDRVRAVGVAAGQVPIEADRDPEVRSALDPVIATRTDVVSDMSPAEFAATVAPLIAAPEMPIELAREAIVEGKDAAYLRELDSVDGLADQLALGLVAAVEHGLDGVELDMRRMVSPWSFDLTTIETPVLLWYGSNDVTFGPAAGRWLADALPRASLDVVEASHLLPLLRWGSILEQLAAHVTRKDTNATQS